MRALLRVTVALFLTVSLNAADAHAAGVRGAVRDVAVIQDGAGSARILFRASSTISDLSEAIVSKAHLAITTTGAAEARALRVRVYSVTTVGWNSLGATWTGWSGPGGDYDEELFASAELDFARGGATATFDVTAILKEVLESGMTADGFLLTVDPADGTGIASGDLTRFGTLSTATLDVQYRKVPGALLAREGRAPGS
jgi:hypothetical protein